MSEQAVVVDTCTALMETLDAFLRTRPAGVSTDWADLGYPVIDRGDHAILPLLIAAATPASERAVLEINERLWRHWGYWYGGHDYRVGRFNESDEWAKKALSKKFEASKGLGHGPTWWDIADHVVIFVSSTAPDGTGMRSALHVVPREWVFAGHTTPRTKRDLSHCRTVVRTVTAADFDWWWPTDELQPGQLWATAPHKPHP